MLTSLEYKCINKQTRPSPMGFQSPKFSDSDFREVRGLGRPKSSAYWVLPVYDELIRAVWEDNGDRPLLF
jgi:hypothetical protein